MIFDKDIFYAKLHVLTAECNNAKTERFLLEQAEIITNYVLVGQSCGSCGCGYGSFEGDSRLCDSDKEAKWLEERTYGIVTVLNELACFYRDSANPMKAVEIFNKAEEEMNNYSSIINTFNYVQIIMNKAGTYRIMGKYDMALAEFDKAERALNHIADIDCYLCATLYNNIANVYNDLKNYDKAIEYYEKAIFNIRKTNDKYDELATGLSNLAIAYYRIKKYEEAEAAIDESLSIFKELGDDKNPNYAGVLNTKAMFCYYSGDYATAAEMFESAVEKIEQISGRNKDYLSGCRNCSYAYEKLGNKEKAEQYKQMSVN